MTQVEVIPVEAWSMQGNMWPSRFVSAEILDVLSQANGEQIITDNRPYQDMGTARLLVDAYRRRFKRANPGKRLQVRIIYETDGWKWYARVTE
jgi:hypothetical protein